MNAQGWIAREQILGEEARARCGLAVVQSLGSCMCPWGCTVHVGGTVGRQLMTAQAAPMVCCAPTLPLPSAVRAAACLESLCGSRRTPPTRPPSSCCCQTCRTAWPPPHRSGGAAWRQLVPHGVICSSIAFTTLPAVGPCPSLESSVLTLCLLNALFLVCHLPVLFCHSQAQQWSEEDRADGELLKAAWPRLR